MCEGSARAPRSAFRPRCTTSVPLGLVDVELDLALQRSATVHGGRGQALTPLVPGGPDRIVGRYSSSWVRPSKVRLLIISRATSG